MDKNCAMAWGKRCILRTVVSVVLAGCAAFGAKAQVYGKIEDAGPQAGASGGKLYCNMAALSSSERVAHMKLTAQIIASRTAVVEMPKGYEFQFDPSVVSIGELATWVVAEAKCCPFFDFHIDLEKKGALACLRLTGEEGVKPFIRDEFVIPER